MNVPIWLVYFPAPRIKPLVLDVALSFALLQFADVKRRVSPRDRTESASLPPSLDPFEYGEEPRKGIIFSHSTSSIAYINQFTGFGL